MNPLLLHLDRFSLRALQQKYFTRGKTVISLFSGGEGQFLHFFSWKTTRTVWGLFHFLAFGVKNELYHPLHHPGDKKNPNKTTTKKPQTSKTNPTKSPMCNCQNGLFPHKSSCSMGDTLPIKSDSPLCWGSSCWEVNLLDWRKSPVICKVSCVLAASSLQSTYESLWFYSCSHGNTSCSYGSF